jgi:ABC-type polysaccharide/polyol phosphate export permease
MSLQPSTRDWRLAKLDLTRCLENWHIWVLLGVTDIRQRYMRSRFGQFWITLSTGMFVLGVGSIYAGLFHVDVRGFLPFLAVNMTVWSLISGTIFEGSGSFIEAANYMKQDSLPKTVFTMRILMRNCIAFVHNLIIIPIVYILLLIPPSPVALLAIPGLCLVLVAAFFYTLALGTVCARFRDLGQIVTNLMQLAFFVTPIMWRLEQLGPRGNYVLWFNPFASLLQIVSEPMQGRIPALSTYGIALGYVAVLALISWTLFARFRARIVYWL